MKNEKRRMKKEKRRENRGQIGGGKVMKLFSLLIVICSLLTVTVCSVETPRVETTAIPEGMGRVTLNLGGVSARTILPLSDALNLTSFVSYELIFRPTVDGANDDFTRTTFETGSTFEPIYLVPGTYGLTVNAYKTGNVLAARGQVGGIAVTDGGTATALVILRAVMDEGQGSFGYNITLTPGATTLNTATMEIYQGNTRVGDVVNLNTGLNEGTITPLNAGLYTVRFNLAGSDATSQRAIVWNELMHVYATLTSTFTQEFTNAYFHRTHWNVTYDLNHIDYDGDPITGEQTVIHGGTLTDPDPNWTGYRLLGWYTAADGSGTKWVFNDDDDPMPFHDDMTLYAQWERIVGTVTVTLQSESMLSTFNITPTDPITVSRISTNDNHTVNVAVTGLFINGTGVTLGDYTFTWEVLGVGEYDGSDDVIGTGTTFTLSGANTAYNTSGGHALRVTATRGDDSYQRNIHFTIVD